MWHDPDARARLLRVPRARPRRPSCRRSPARSARRTASCCRDAKTAFRKDIHNYVDENHPTPSTPSSTRPSRSRSRPATRPRCPFADDGAVDVAVRRQRRRGPAEQAGQGHVRRTRRVRARPRRGRRSPAITSCTNTSNPSVMLGAGAAGPQRRREGPDLQAVGQDHAWRPGSQVVTDYYEKAGLWPYLEKLGFYLVGYGCTTCIGNSGPLPDEISTAINDNDLSVTAVLSGNRNFEGRINPDVKMNYLASPPLVIAYALAGTMDFDFETDPLGKDTDGNDVFLKDIWPSHAGDRRRPSPSSINQEMFTKNYADVFEGDERWRNLPTPERQHLRVGSERRPTCASPRTSTACRPSRRRSPTSRAPACSRCSAIRSPPTTSRPAGTIKPGTPAAQYLDEHGVDAQGLQLLRLAPRQPRGDDPRHVRQHPAAQPAARRRRRAATPATSPRTAARRRSSTTPSQNYQAAGIPLVVLGGKEYGSGSSRDWAAKGTSLLGVRAVITESFERIHRSNLIGMGVIPLQFPAGESAASRWGWTAPRSSTSPASRSSTTARRRRRCKVTATKERRRRRSSSTRSSASTPPVRPTTTATAASCSTCCATC